MSRIAGSNGKRTRKQLGARQVAPEHRRLFLQCRRDAVLAQIGHFLCQRDAFRLLAPQKGLQRICAQSPAWHFDADITEGPDNIFVVIASQRDGLRIVDCGEKRSQRPNFNFATFKHRRLEIGANAHLKMVGRAHRRQDKERAPRFNPAVPFAVLHYPFGRSKMNNDESSGHAV